MVVAHEFSLNTGWMFGRYRPGSEHVGFDEEDFVPVTIPHCVTPLSWGNWKPSRWEHMWVYRRHLDGSGLLRGRVAVCFDGVMVNATVLVNGKVAGFHQGGYLPWVAELTGFLEPGDNVLAIVVDSRRLPVPPDSRLDATRLIDFLQPGGIYRDVTLRVLPEIFLSDVFARPANVLSAEPRIDVDCTLDASTTVAAPVQLTAALSDGPDELATVSRALEDVLAGVSSAGLRLELPGAIGLWSPGSPKLYTLTTTVSVPGIGTHSLTKRIGFREAEFRPDGFFLNGERLTIFGLNRHQLFPYTGMAMPARVQRRDAEILRNELNCNMVRCCHYPQSPHFLDACDELGLMVWEEAPGWHEVGDGVWQDLVVQNVRDMVVRDRSRPSVVIWGTRLNETVGHADLWRRTRQAARDLDGSRPSSGAMLVHFEEAWNEDVFAYNDYHLGRDHTARLLDPRRGVPYLITEAVGVVRPRPRHYRWADRPAHLARQAALHAQVHDIARSDPRFGGVLAWAAFDYASLQGAGGDHIKWAGVADGFRIAKPAAAIYLSQVDPLIRPVVAPGFFWDPGSRAEPPGPGPRSMIATNCERVEVFVDGVAAAAGYPAADEQLYCHLAYPPVLVDLTAIPENASELRIQGFAGGCKAAELVMSADPSGDHLDLHADDTAITGDGCDATRVVFGVVDAYGNRRRSGSGEVTLSAKGPAELVGDNRFLLGAYGGSGAVWLRSRPGEPGRVTVTAEHPLLGHADVEVDVIPAEFEPVC
jgi:beta-galactosidase